MRPVRGKKGAVEERNTSERRDEKKEKNKKSKSCYTDD